MNSIAANLFAAAAVAVVMPGTVRAREADADTWMQVRPPKTQARVPAERVPARADGGLRAPGLARRPEAASGRRAQAEVVRATAATDRPGEHDVLDCAARPVCGN